MACSERDVVAYLNGGLDAEASARFERHLLGCEACWRAVRDDRKGRRLAEQLRSLAPPGLRDRVRAGVELAAGGQTRRTFRISRTLVAIAAAAVVIAGSVTFATTQLRSADPAVISDVLAMASASRPVHVTHTYDGRRVEMSMYEMHGVPVVVAKSDAAFPMPDNATPMGSGHGEPWMAHRHEMSLVSLSHPTHVLLAGHMPATDLLAFAHDLGFTP
jgi:anti-sigma factor RsiW